MEGYRTVGYAVPQPIGGAADFHRLCYVETSGVEVVYVIIAGVYVTVEYREFIEVNGKLIMVPY